MDGQKRFENAIEWTEIFLKTEKNIYDFKRKRIRVDRASAPHDDLRRDRVILQTIKERRSSLNMFDEY